MKKRYALFIFILIECFFSISLLNAQNACLAMNADGSVVYKLLSSKKMTNNAIRKMEKQAIMDVIYSGIQISELCSAQPPLITDEAAKAKFNLIQSSFFSNKGTWLEYIHIQNVKYEGMCLNVLIERARLRSYLEAHNIILRLNNGF